MAKETPFPFPASMVEDILNWTRQRILGGPDPKNGAQSFEALEPALGGSITQNGIGAEATFKLFTDTIVPSTRPFDHPTSLSFVASAPSPAASSLDAALGAAGIFAGNWDGGAGAIHAENQALAWLCDLAGWPETAGGVFVAGGTLGNLSSLHAARNWRARQLGRRPERWALVCSTEAHSSIKAVAEVMDVDLIRVAVDPNGRMSAAAAREVIDDPDRIFAIVANAGATNCGAVDDIAGLADLAEELGLWLHLDGAYGLAALADPASRPEFSGIERAHSFIVDPHKWLFAPYDSCAVVYRDAGEAAQAHGQKAVYLDTVDKTHWNPSDYALHLTRRARGLPLWFSLATHGSAAYGRAIAQTRDIARVIADGIDAMDGLELLLGPQLTVILFTAPGLSDEQMERWAEGNRRSGDLLCLPTSWRGEKVFRLCVVNPLTDPDQVLSVLSTLVPKAGA